MSSYIRHSFGLCNCILSQAFAKLNRLKQTTVELLRFIYYFLQNVCLFFESKGMIFPSWKTVKKTVFFSAS